MWHERAGRNGESGSDEIDRGRVIAYDPGRPPEMAPSRPRSPRRWRSSMQTAPGRSTHARFTGSTAPSRSRRELAVGPGGAGPSGPRPGPAARSLRVSLASILGGIVLAAAWLLPETVA